MFTGYGWVGKLLVEDRARVSYALNGARGNPEMESFNSRFKTESRSLLLDAHTLAELQHLVAERMRYHNGERRHSTNRIPSTRSFHRDSVAADVASQIRMPEGVQEMGCTTHSR